AMAAFCRRRLAIFTVDLLPWLYPRLLGVSTTVKTVTGCKRSVSRTSSVARQGANVLELSKLEIS
ncbi:hypothetical protein BDB00DRAFT_756176, partial [Zychaea mexicana]|uniref:uncharacterized protein n=1 Tax=Zychaea mexicana TaxID=64656 RepID=UPI0022FE8372